MDILALKPGHDGHVSFVSGGELVFSLEAEKDNWPRYMLATPPLLLKALERLQRVPDAVALSGWVKGGDPAGLAVGAGYFGSADNTIVDEGRTLLGHNVRFFSSSHERSHVLCAYGLSPFPQGQPCYCLVWEGSIGSFYRVDEHASVRKLGQVLAGPGTRYLFLYALADPTAPLDRPRMNDAGKLMALASYGEPGAPDEEERRVIEFALSDRSFTAASKLALQDSKYFNVGVESDAFKRLARRFSDALFDRFHAFAQRHLHEGLPLLIAGGCGLNCDWNSAWAACGLFPDVFVPPCANDTGSAIGTAIDAMRFYEGRAKLRWTPYAGEEFVVDRVVSRGVSRERLDYHRVAMLLAAGKVLAWVQGRCEIGPRALGNRSLLAGPFDAAIAGRLNRIKKREAFRPIAPICLEEERERHFESRGPSPHMLYFQRVLSDRLAAVTHVDGSARMQSVRRADNPRAYDLLCAFKQVTGIGVLCNTSLNYPGAGFINTMSELHAYCVENDVDGYVVGDELFTIDRACPPVEPTASVQAQPALQ